MDVLMTQKECGHEGGQAFLCDCKEYFMDIVFSIWLDGLQPAFPVSLSLLLPQLWQLLPFRELHCTMNVRGCLLVLGDPLGVEREFVRRKLAVSLQDDFNAPPL